MAMLAEHLPTRPRKASAGRRRRRVRQLAYQVHGVVPEAATVLLTPVATTSGTVDRVYVVVARNSVGEQVTIPQGGSRRIANLMQGAYPTARWDSPQTWHAETNQLTSWWQRERRMAVAA